MARYPCWHLSWQASSRLHIIEQRGSHWLSIFILQWHLPLVRGFHSKPVSVHNVDKHTTSDSKRVVSFLLLALNSTFFASYSVLALNLTPSFLSDGVIVQPLRFVTWLTTLPIIVQLISDLTTNSGSAFWYLWLSIRQSKLVMACVASAFLAEITHELPFLLIAVLFGALLAMHLKAQFEAGLNECNSILDKRSLILVKIVALSGFSISKIILN